MPFDALPVSDPALETLRRAREILGKPGAWTQKSYARIGKREAPFSHPAVNRFCLLGAASRTKSTERVNVPFLDAFAEALGFKDRVDLVAWNDRPGQTQAKVLARLDAAIERREAELIGKALGDKR